MKKILILSFLLFANIVFAQEKKVISEVNFESIEISVDTLEELDTIDWQEMSDIFKKNKPESKISLKVTVKDIKKENYKGSFSITLGGESQKIDSLVTQLKEKVLKMKQLVINFNNKNK